MGHPSKWQIWVHWSHFSRLLVTVDFDGLSTKLIIIFIIVLGIWVIRASGNLGCCSLGVIITLLHGREHRHRSQSALERFISFYTPPPVKFYTASSIT